MGISGLTGNETFTELVPDVLNIPTGLKLRHIVVGDNLYNKKLYFTFPADLNTTIDTYHRSFGDTGITYRAFIASFTPTNPINTNSISWWNNYCIHTYNTTGYTGWGSVTMRAQSSSYYLGLYKKSGPTNTEGTYSMVGLDLASSSPWNINAPVVYIDTTNPAYQYVWIEDV